MCLPFKCSSSAKRGISCIIDSSRLAPQKVVREIATLMRNSDKPESIFTIVDCVVASDMPADALETAHDLAEYGDDSVLLEFRMRFYKEDVSVESEIRTFEEYESSCCIGILFFVDNGYVEVYSKSMDVIEEVHNLIKAYRCDEIEYITSENDGRYSFLL